MHILTEGSGSPAVVIVPALAGNVLEWVRVQRAASAETQIVVYDRAGVGWSDPPSGPLTIDGMADDLHALLDAACIRTPVIIAGHSLGGAVARRFQARYPGEVCGMLLVDSSHEDQSRRLGPRYGTRYDLTRAARRQARILGARRLAAHLGLVRGLDAASLSRETVPEYASAAKALSLSTMQRRTVVREMLLLAWPQGQPQSLGSLPLTVLSAGSPHRRQWPAWPAWQELQDELAGLSSDSVYLAALNGDHNVHLDDPEIVVQTIGDLVRRCRWA